MIILNASLKYLKLYRVRLRSGVLPARTSARRHRAVQGMAEGAKTQRKSSQLFAQQSHKQLPLEER